MESCRPEKTGRWWCRRSRWIAGDCLGDVQRRVGRGANWFTMNDEEIAGDIAANAAVVLSVDELVARVEAIFLKAGLSADQAAAVARVIGAGERDGAKSHGIYRVEGCLNTVRAGKVAATAIPELQEDGSAIVRVLAGGGFSCAAFEVGLPILAERARRFGLAALVVND